ncbi:MAG: PIN domain-containing protein [Verrucomicrobiota bacterium]
MRFVDTNILLYRVSPAPAEKDKAEVASSILRDRDPCLSVQVLQEFYVQATRESRESPLSHPEATGLIETWKRFSVQPMTLELMDNALSAKLRWQLSFWDAAIIEAARLQACSTLLSEDLTHDQNYGGIQVINPFIDL